MSDNTVLQTMTGGDTYRSKDRTTAKTTILGLDLNPSGHIEILDTGVVLSDAMSLPATGASRFAANLLWNGTNWFRASGHTATQGQVVVNAQSSGQSISWTSGSGVDSSLVIPVSNYGSVLLTYNSGGTVTSGFINFEFSDDNQSNWYSLLGDRGGAFTAETGYNISLGKQSWGFDVGAATHFRARLNPSLGGAGTGNFRATATIVNEPASIIGQGNSPWSQNITQVNGSTLSLGQTTQANSLPVAIASNQTLNVTGSVSQTSGPWTQNLVQLSGNAISTNTGNADAGTLRIVHANNQLVPISGAVTQSAGPWTNNLVQISGTAVDNNKGAASAGTQRVVLASDQNTLSTQPSGNVAHAAADAGNPLKIGFVAQTGLYAALSDAQRANSASDVYGRQLVTHIPHQLQSGKHISISGALTGSAIWTPAAGKKIAVTSATIGLAGTTAGKLTLWFGQSADTTYTIGTDQSILTFSAAPTSTSKPALVFTPSVPVYSWTADYILRITTDAALSGDVTVQLYEF